MSNSALAEGIRHLRRKLAEQQPNEDSDERLLHAFTSRHDDGAFAVLVRRHGPMVLHVCRRVLGHEQDAEDAFQATFLVLARNSAALRNKASLTSFLHGTAYRTAMKAKQSAARRRKYECQAPQRSSVNPADELSWSEVRALLDEEIARLPEKYRSVFVLCCLENLSRAEAGQRLGLKERTVLSRLSEARKRLSGRLMRRGVELTAVSAATALTTGSATALPPPLLSTTIKAALQIGAGEGWTSVVSASVAELVQGALPTMSMDKAKLVTALLLSATLLAGAGAWACRTLATLQADETQEQATTASFRPLPSQKAGTPRKEKRGSMTVSGRVLYPDGKPVNGARLYWPRIPKMEPLSEEDIEIPQRATTDADGCFRFELPNSDINPDWNLALLAAADGYGVAWAEWSTLSAGGELTLRLVKDQPIEGQIINTEGKPMAGVRVSIVTLGALRENKVDAFVNAWKNDWQLAMQQMTQRMFLPLDKILRAPTTDKDGRFRIAGAGADRLVEMRLHASGIAQAALYIVNHAGFDAAPVNKAVLDRIPAELRQPGQPPLLYGPKRTFVVPAGRRIEGRVREAGSGKPVAGYTISVGVGYGFGIEDVSDKEGRYKLVGVPKVKQYLFSAEPPDGSAWLRAGARLDDPEGVQPLTVDFTVARGIRLSGRVFDKTTGKGAKGSIRFAPLPGNTFAGKPGYDSYKYERLSTDVDYTGRFNMCVIPGAGVLLFQAQGGEKVNGGQNMNPYKIAEFDGRDREHVKITERGDDRYFTALDNSSESLDYQNAVKYLDLAADAGTAKCDLFVERGLTSTIKIEDADGKPLRGTRASGVTAFSFASFLIEDAACTVFALDPKKPRRLLFFHAERNLAGSLTLRGGEKEPPVAHLGPAGSVIGRVVDRDGQPIAGADVNLSAPDPDASELYRQLNQRRPPIRTDKDGRFRIDGIVPDLKFALSIYQGRTFLVGEPRIGVRQVKPGRTLDLGDVRVKPGG